jgi:hypothetical protein
MLAHILSKTSATMMSEHWTNILTTKHVQGELQFPTSSHDSEGKVKFLEARKREEGGGEGRRGRRRESLGSITTIMHCKGTR